MQQSATAVQLHTLSYFALVIDGVGILVGIFALILVIKTLGKIGGQVGSAFKFTLVGVACQMLALTYNLLTEEFQIISVPSVIFGSISSHHIHDVLMVLGMIFFVLAAQQFSKLST